MRTTAATPTRRTRNWMPLAAAAMVLCATCLWAGCADDEPADDFGADAWPSIPTDYVWAEDGTEVPLSYAQPADDSPEPMRYTVPGHGTGYRIFICQRTQQPWYYGKDGQTSSPFANGE